MNDDDGETHTGAIGTASRDATTQQLGLSTVGDRCVACGTPLSSDQRYCVNCGERRSKPRFSLPQMAEPAAKVPATTGRPRRRPHAPAGVTVVAGVGTLLLAMGVGVLIGRTNTRSVAQGSSPKTQVVYLNGPSPNGSATTSSAATTVGKQSTSKSKSDPKSKSKSHSKSTSKPSAATTAKAGAAASKVLGGKNLPPPTVTVGATGSGPGYQSGHFTGKFFGGG
jgi:hypothetical protein